MSNSPSGRVISPMRKLEMHDMMPVIPPELLSRFLVVEFKQYSREEFIQVSRHVLKVREGLTEEEADEIARLLVDSTRDVRDSVKAGRLLKSGASIEFIEKFFKRNSKQKTLTW